MLKGGKVLSSEFFDFEVYPVFEETTLKLKGGNEKGLLVILGEEASSELKEFLAKILKAVGFELATDALVVEVPSGQKISFAKMAASHEIKSALLFGLSPEQATLNLNAPVYRPFTTNGISFLFANQLSAIHADANLKRPLWEGLKKMFEK